MIRIAIVLILVVVVAGCGASRKSTAGRSASLGDFAPTESDAAPYVTGFMDGYATARPQGRLGPADSPAKRAERNTSFSKTEQYEHGRYDGYRTGASDARQAE